MQKSWRDMFGSALERMHAASYLALNSGGERDLTDTVVMTPVDFYTCNDGQRCQNIDRLNELTQLIPTKKDRRSCIRYSSQFVSRHWRGGIPKIRIFSHAVQSLADEGRITAHHHNNCQPPALWNAGCELWQEVVVSPSRPVYVSHQQAPVMDRGRMRRPLTLCFDCSRTQLSPSYNYCHSCLHRTRFLQKQSFRRDTDDVKPYIRCGNMEMAETMRSNSDYF